MVNNESSIVIKSLLFIPKERILIRPRCFQFTIDSDKMTSFICPHNSSHNSYADSYLHNNYYTNNSNLTAI